jgi:hypothetical protein
MGMRPLDRKYRERLLKRQITDREFCRTIRCCHGRPHALRHRRTRYFWEALSNNDHRLDKEKMLHKFLLIGASALALVSSALAALPAVADDNDFFYLTQPNGKKIVFAPISIVAIWRPPQGVCKGETQIVTGPMSFCVSDQPEDVIKKLQDFPCVENPRTSAQTLRRCK